MWGVVPEVLGSIPMPGRKWSTVVVVASIGIRAGVVHVVPLAELLNTISFVVQPALKRQSDQATKALPAPSMAAVGRLGLRMPPASKWLLMEETSTLLPQVLPPLVDTKELIPVPS